VIPSQAAIVIVGGGVIGCSIAYHLAKRGARDVLLLERRQLTHGATWHAAGLVGQMRSSLGLTRMMQHSAALYRRLEAETGQATGWHAVGSLRVAASKARLAEITRQATRAASFGLDAELVAPAEARRLFPLLDLTDIEGAVWIASDGHADPASLTQSLAVGARAGGVVIREGVRVVGLDLAGSRVRSVATDQGAIACENVIDAAGMWGREIAAMAGVDAAVCAVEHQYVVTEAIPGQPKNLPTFRDPDGRFYAKPEVGGLAIGGWEDFTPGFGREGIREDFGPELLPRDLERFAPIGEAALARIPAFGDVGIKNVINGPIPITPDGEPMLGSARDVANLFIACGFTSGIAAAGGAGMALANLILDGDPGIDITSLDPARFGDIARRSDELFARSTTAYANYYSLSLT
jgi:4-methylaminobutanoate oxidase (formaldehyde-forming)